jgi:hypothetical protein
MLTTEKLTLTRNRLTWGVNINTVLMLIDFVLMLTLLCAAVFFERLHTARARAYGKGQRVKGKGQTAKGKGQGAKWKGQRGTGKGQRGKGRDDQRGPKNTI